MPNQGFRPFASEALSGPFMDRFGGRNPLLNRSKVEPWTTLGASEGRLGASWGRPGASWERLGASWVCAFRQFSTGTFQNHENH